MRKTVYHLNQTYLSHSGPPQPLPARNYVPPWFGSWPAWELAPLFLSACPLFLPPHSFFFFHKLIHIGFSHPIWEDNIGRRPCLSPQFFLHKLITQRVTQDLTASGSQPQNSLDLFKDPTPCPTLRLVPRKPHVHVCSLGVSVFAGKRHEITWK